MPGLVHCKTECEHARAVGLAQRHHGVTDAVGDRPPVRAVVHILREAIAQQHQQFYPTGEVLELLQGVAQGSAHAGRTLGRNGTEAALDRR